MYTRTKEAIRYLGYGSRAVDDKTLALVLESFGELDQVAEKLRSAGKGAAADQLRKAVDEFQKGNLYLNLALSLVKES